MQNQLQMPMVFSAFVGNIISRVLIFLFFINGNTYGNIYGNFNSSAKTDSGHKPVNSKSYFYIQKDCEMSMVSFQKKDVNTTRKL